jgi:hypothetical protein
VFEKPLAAYGQLTAVLGVGAAGIAPVPLWVSLEPRRLRNHHRSLTAMMDLRFRGIAAV